MQKKTVVLFMVLMSLIGVIGTSSATLITSSNMIVATDHYDGRYDAGHILQTNLTTKKTTIAISAEEIRYVTGNNEVRFTGDNLGFDNFGNFYFTEAASTSVIKRSVDGKLIILVSNQEILEVTKKSVASLEGLTVGIDGFVYVTEGISNTVLEIDPVTGAIKIFAPKNEFNDFSDYLNIKMGPVADSKGSIFVAAIGSSGGTSGTTPGGVYDVSGGKVSTVAVAIPSGPVGSMTVAPNDDIIITDDDTDTIYRITPPDGEPTVFLSEEELKDILGDDVDLNGPIAFDEDGNFYLVVDGDDEEIYKWNVEDKKAGTIDPSSGSLFLPKLSLLTSLGIDGIEFSGGIVFAPDLQAVGPAPVPEPGTIFLFTIGLIGLMGFKSRHRRKT